ncbi:MAG: hypothetical protein JXM71_05975, partial [Spirochaetales bacterium]|nr:hypothetical protein [Spirochaetales bacterium]
LVTDGMHSPAPGTPYAQLDQEGVATELDRVVSKIREQGWTMRIVRVPFNGTSAASGQPGSGQPGSGQPGSEQSGALAQSTAPGEAASSAPGSGDYLSNVADAANTSITVFDPENGSKTIDDTLDLPRVSFPADLGVRGYSFILPMVITNRSSRTLPVELTEILLGDGSDILRENELTELAPGASATIKAKVLVPATIPEGSAQLSLEPRFADGLRVRPALSTITIELKRSALAAFWRNSALLALFLTILAIACAALLIVALYVRRIHRRAEEPIVDALIDSAAAEDDAATVAARSQHRDTAAVLSAAVSGEHRGADLNAASLESRRESTLAASRLANAGYGASTHEEARAASTLNEWKQPASSRRALPVLSSRQEAVVNTTREPVHYEPRIVKPGATRLVLRVTGQNPNIGKRNIHPMQAGTRKSVGGSRSDFCVFLLPVPRNVAYLYYDGSNATLVPAKPELFPDYDGPVTDCLGQDVRMLTPKGKPLTLRFERYVPPVENLNKLLHCIESPGLSLRLSDPEDAEASKAQSAP